MSRLVFYACIAVALCATLASLAAWLLHVRSARRTAEANELALSALPTKCADRMRDAIESRLGPCKLTLMGSTEQTVCNSHFVVFRLECRQIGALLMPYESHPPSQYPCTVVAGNGDCIAVTSNDCEEFGKLLAQDGCVITTDEDMDGIARLWELATPWDAGTFHKTGVNDNGRVVYERASEHIVEWLGIHLDKDGKCIGTSLQIRRRDTTQR